MLERKGGGVMMTCCGTMEWEVPSRSSTPVIILTILTRGQVETQIVAFVKFVEILQQGPLTYFPPTQNTECNWKEQYVTCLEKRTCPGNTVLTFQGVNPMHFITAELGCTFPLFLFLYFCFLCWIHNQSITSVLHCWITSWCNLLIFWRILPNQFIIILNYIKRSWCSY